MQDGFAILPLFHCFLQGYRAANHIRRPIMQEMTHYLNGEHVKGT